MMNQKIKPKGMYYVCIRTPIFLIFTFFLSTFCTHAQDTQSLKISGKVLDEYDQPMTGVVVQEVGTNNTVVTNFKGKYAIYNIAGDDARLRFTFTGYKAVELTIDKRRQIVVNMKLDEMGLEEIVVVGYGSQKKESIIGSISTVKPSTLLANQSSTLSNSLAGLVSGVIGVQRNGELGSTGAEFYIRGMSTFSQGSRTPLVLVDGIERSLDNIIAEEIESFSVLKDAAATAVYGVRGANGAILIKTKRGIIGKPQVSVKSNMGVTMPTRMPKYVGGPTYMETMNTANLYSGIQAPFSAAAIESTRLGADPDLYPNVNWIDEVMNDYATNQRVTADISGGTERLRYRFITGYYNEFGMLKTDKNVAWHNDSKYRYQKYNVRSNIDMDITSSMLLSFSVGGHVSDRSAPGWGLGTSIIEQAMKASPVVFPKKYSTGEIAKSQNGNNPWAASTQTGYQTQYENGVQSLVTLSQNIGKLWDPLTGLVIKGSFSFDTYNYHNISRYTYPSTYMASGRDGEGNLILSMTNQGTEFLGFSKASGGSRRIYLEVPLTYDRTFNDIHHVGGMLLFNRDSYVNHDAGDAISAFPYRHQGLSGRFTYNYDQKYYGEFNFGYNGSENFQKGFRYGFFPSFALGWMVSNEKFMADISDVVSKLKIRGSWGKVGNDNIGGRRFAYVSTINQTGGYDFGYNSDNGFVGYREGDFGISNLTWEISKKTDIGLELGLFNSVNLTVDVYRDNRSKIFMQRKTLTETAGYNIMPWANFGRINNKGIDVSLDYTKSFNKDLMVTFMGNLTYTANKVLEDDESEAILNSPRRRTGSALNIPMLYLADRLYTEGDFDAGGNLLPELPRTTFGTVHPGDIKYKDLDGDGMITENDQTLFGNPTLPQLIYGFGFTVKYKNIDFGAIFQGAGKTSMILDVTSGQNWLIPGSGGLSLGNVLSNVDDRWTPENPNQNVFWPRLSNTNSGNNNKASTWWQRDASFLRMKNIEIGYVPFKYRKQPLLRTSRVFLRGSNLLTLSSFKLWDPELGGGGYKMYPMSKSIAFGLELNF